MFQQDHAAFAVADLRRSRELYGRIANLLMPTFSASSYRLGFEITTALSRGNIDGLYALNGVRN